MKGLRIAMEAMRLALLLSLIFAAYAEKPNTRFSLDVFVFQGDGIAVTVYPQNTGPGVKRLKSVFSKKISSGDGDQDNPEFLAANQGEYEICLSNDRRFEQGTKHVLLNVKEKTEDASSTKKEPTENTDKDKKENKDMKIINERLEDLREEFEKIKMHQIREKKSLTLRENEAEENHKSMVRSSVTETVVLLLVSAGQIFFVRRWFQGKGTLLKQWS